MPANPNGRTDRRAFLVASATSVAGLAARPALGAARAGEPRAKSCILFFLCGGASHIDTWDLKPEAPAEFRGTFQPIATTAPGIRLCEHLSLTARQAHHLAVVHGVNHTVSTNDHHAGYYYNLTGHEPDPSFLTLGNDRTPQPDDWPYLGCVAASRLPQHPGLPNAITLPHKPSQAPYTRPGQFAARLGVEFDPLYIDGSREHPTRFQAPALALAGDLTASRLLDRRSLLGMLDQSRRERDAAGSMTRWDTLQRRAWDLLASSGTTAAFDLAGEPDRVRERYGANVNGMSLLLARRLVEAGVPFVTVFWKEDMTTADRCKSGGGWDTHGDNFHCLKQSLLPEFDRAYSALLEDLSARGLLETTLVLVTSEMGRKPRIGDPRSGGVSGAGRDHWTHCQSVLLAGGGIQGGQQRGSSDRRGEYPGQKPVTPAHIAHTVYHALGVRDLMQTAPDGRVYHLLETGEPLLDLF